MADEVDERLPPAFEQLLERLRTSPAPVVDTTSPLDERILSVLRSGSIRDSHETLVDGALLAPPLPPGPAEGHRATRPAFTPSGIHPLAFEPVPTPLELGSVLARRLVAAAVSGLTVALFLGLMLWMASAQVRSASAAHDARPRAVAAGQVTDVPAAERGDAPRSRERSSGVSPR